MDKDKPDETKEDSDHSLITEGTKIKDENDENNI